MGLDGVLREVEARGGREVREIREAAGKEADAVLSEARTQARQILESAEGRAREEAARMRKAQIPAAELEARRQILHVEREILATVLSRVKERLSRLEPAKRKEWVALLARRAMEEGGQRLYGNAPDLAALRAAGPVGGEIRCTGGVAAEAAGGAAWIDYTYDTLLEGVWRASLKEVHEALFPR